MAESGMRARAGKPAKKQAKLAAAPPSGSGEKTMAAAQTPPSADDAQTPPSADDDESLPTVEIGGTPYRVQRVENSVPILLAVHDSGSRNPLRIFAALERLLHPADYTALHARLDQGGIQIEEVSAAVIAATRAMLRMPGAAVERPTR